MPLIIPALFFLLSAWLLSAMYLLSTSISKQRRRLPACTLQPPSHAENVMLVIAHPDDECMFFAPVLLALAFHGSYKLHLLCLSTGNADGLGSIRAKELIASCQHLAIAKEDITVVDHANLQDGFHHQWALEDMTPHVVRAAQRQNIHTILTFDAYGVSGHPNHGDVCKGVRSALVQLRATGVRAWQLVPFSNKPLKYVSY